MSQPLEDLTIKQKKFIAVNQHTLSSQEIAKRISIPNKLVTYYIDYLKNPLNHNSTSIEPEPASHLSYGNELIIFGLILIIVIIYINSLGNEFLSDDIDSIVNNPNIGNIGYAVTGHFSGFLLSIIYTISKLQPFLYHINSILWHIGVTILAFFVTNLISNKRIAVITAFLFAVHPIHTEAVTWISGLPYITYSFFTLLTLLIFILVDQHKLPKKYMFVLIPTTALAVYASEKAIVIPILLFAYAFIYSSWKQALRLGWPIACVLVIYAVSLATRVSGRVSSVTPSYEQTSVFFNPLIQIPTAIATYIKLLFFPTTLTLYHEDLRMSSTEFGIYAFFTIFLIALGFFVWRKGYKTLAFGFAVFFLSLSPTLLPLKISWVVAERYVYLASWGFFICIAVCISYLFKKTWIGGWIIISIIILLLSVRTIVRNTDWANQDTMWPATLAASPTSSLAYNNMGDYYGRHGNLPKAIEAFGKAVEIRPQYPAAIHNLGNAYLQSGNASKAAELFEKAIALNPTLLESLVNLGIINTKSGNYQKAEEYFTRAEKAYPNTPLVYNAWGTYYYERHDVTRAKQMFEKALQINPNDQNAIQSLSVLNQQPQEKK